MGNTIRPSAAHELKDALQIIDADPHGWWAIHTALANAARRLVRGGVDLLSVAQSSLTHAVDAGFGLGRPDVSATRYTGKPIMAWQDTLYVVNELAEWRFPDEVLLVAWLIECGGPEMRRGPATASFQQGTPEYYVGDTRNLYNKGLHGNGDGWPTSTQWRATHCRYMANAPSYAGNPPGTWIRVVEETSCCRYHWNC